MVIVGKSLSYRISGYIRPNATSVNKMCELGTVNLRDFLWAVFCFSQAFTTTTWKDFIAHGFTAFDFDLWPISKHPDVLEKKPSAANTQ